MEEVFICKCSINMSIFIHTEYVIDCMSETSKQWDISRDPNRNEKRTRRISSVRVDQAQTISYLIYGLKQEQSSKNNVYKLRRQLSCLPHYFNILKWRIFTFSKHFLAKVKR